MRSSVLPVTRSLIPESMDNRGRVMSDAKTIFKCSTGQPFSLKYPLVLVPRLQPLTLARASEPFSHPDWLFEIKWDGFRSLVRIEQGKCRLVSRQGNDFKSFRTLNESLLAELKVRSLVLDGEIVCLNDEGKSEFRDLLFRQGEPRFVAFDLLWHDGQDLRYSPLTERKHKLRSILSANSERILYCDHIESDGENLFRLACDNDLEGIVAKRKFDPYIENQARWLKVRNPDYSQWQGREELFDRERESDPDLFLSDDCFRARAEH